MKRIGRLSVVVVLLMVLRTGIGHVPFEAATIDGQSGVDDSRDILTIDRFFPHVSTARE